MPTKLPQLCQTLQRLVYELSEAVTCCLSESLLECYTVTMHLLLLQSRLEGRALSASDFDEDDRADELNARSVDSDDMSDVASTEDLENGNANSERGSARVWWSVASERFSNEQARSKSFAFVYDGWCSLHVLFSGFPHFVTCESLLMQHTSTRF